MARSAARITLIQAVLALGALLVVARAGQLQLVQGARWRDEAERSRQVAQVLPARRGGVYDRNGVPLALTQEFFSVGIAPNELREPAADARTVARALNVPAAQLGRALATRKWVYLRGPYNGLETDDLRKVRGVYLDPVYNRQYPEGRLARGVIGALKPDSGSGASGVELALDSVLSGEPGEAIALKDVAGRTYQSPARLSRAPVPGHDVYLTLDAELQEIAERALEDALQQFHAAGGDIVMLDPRSGELLALASRHLVDGKMVDDKASFFTDAFEPGSTAKLFTAGALLMLRRVKSTDAVFAENGVWHMPVDSRGDTRLIHDAHPTTGNLTLGDAIKVSSNIAMGKFSERLSPVEQYDALRDFGFGSPTGVEYPSESPGVLRLPSQWDQFSKPSIAMGYEFQVTPVQLAAAYGALANQGILLTPTLVREIRDVNGKVLYRHQPEPVRRAVTPEVADTLLEYLHGVVGRGGTGEAAQLANWTLVGKTGTAVRHNRAGYEVGHYNASFASIFPLSGPQLVTVVKIEDPDRKYGGQTAAPITRTMLEEAIAARRSALDRSRLGLPAPVRPDSAVDQDEPPATRVVFPLPVPPDTARLGPRPIPNLAGVTLRRAANALHRRGFEVAVVGSGRVARTSPAAGESAPYGSVVTLWAE